jgi:hypothetical protein
MMGTLYKLDFSSGKSYIGITECSAEKRFLQHQKSATAGLRFPVYEAWRKYGAPKLSTLAILESYDLGATEIRAIKAFGTLAPNGYNISEGGERSPMHHPDAKKKVSEKMLKLWQDPAQAEIYALGMQGNSNRKGQPNSAKHNALVSAALKGKPFSESHKAALSKAWVARKAKGLGAPWNKKESTA